MSKELLEIPTNLITNKTLRNIIFRAFNSGIFAYKKGELENKTDEELHLILQKKFDEVIDGAKKHLTKNETL